MFIALVIAGYPTVFAISDTPAKGQEFGLASPVADLPAAPSHSSNPLLYSGVEWGLL